MTAPARIPPLARFEESPIRRALIERLRQIEPGDYITYAELSGIAHADVQHKVRHLLDSARDVLLKRHHVVFDAITNHGLKRMDNSGVLSVVQGREARSRRAVRQTARILTVAEFDKLTPVEQEQYRVSEIRIGVQLQFGGPRAEKTLIRAVQQGTTSQALIEAALKQFEA